MLRKVLFDQYQTARVFLRTGAGAGSLLFVAALLATLCANSRLAEDYEYFLHLPIALKVGTFVLEESMAHWINDGLMAIFFLLVALEIKREMLTGELSSVRLALLPTFAAVGGMVVPALIFVGLNFGDSTAIRAWAVPTATDIAFSLGVLALLASRVPLQAKVFLTAVAVIDDLGAIAIIALFYSEDLKLLLLGGCALVVAVMLVLNILGVKTLIPYLALGGVMWLLMLESGLHATLAGVLTALMIPHGKIVKGSQTPLMGLEHALHNPVTYIILPLFAFANAGVSLAGFDPGVVFSSSLPMGIVLGLLLGKPIGICAAVYLSVRTGICSLPQNIDGKLLFGVSMLCGIGFTVSLFIGNLAFATGGHGGEELINMVKFGVLLGSILAGICGYVFLHYVSRSGSIDRA